jgi:ABC-2 type transport system permease protein
MSIALDRRTRRQRVTMTLWRLEWLRMVRTPRALILLAVYVSVGLLSPVLARYMSALLKLAQSRITITARPPIPADGIAEYVGQSGQTGLIVVVVIATGALAFDSRRGVSIFLRTRATNMWALMLPRYVVPTAFAVTACLLGTLAAWYETALLIGPLPPRAVLAGLLCQAVYLVFAVAVVAAAASITRTALGTVGLSLGTLLFALPLAGTLGAVHDWLPSTLMSAPVDLLGTAQLADYAPALAAAISASPLLLTLAVIRLHRREP